MGTIIVMLAWCLGGGMATDNGQVCTDTFNEYGAPHMGRIVTPGDEVILENGQWVEPARGWDNWTYPEYGGSSEGSGLLDLDSWYDDDVWGWVP